MGFRSSRRPINSSKKVIDALGSTVASTVSTIAIADATSGAAWIDAADTSVPIGSTISSIYLSLFIWLNESVGVNTPIIDWFFAKNPGTNLSFPEPGATGGNDNRRWIMHEEKGLAPDIGNGGAPMVFKGVLKVPKGRQRMGNDDRLFISLLTENHVAFFCLKSIYKFYR